MALYHKLKENGESVSGSYHSSPKKLSHEYKFDINADAVPGDISNADIVLLNLPPSKITSEEHFDSFLNQLSHKEIIFISSTSVYGNQGDVDETTLPLPETENGKRLLNWEQKIQNLFKRYQIIRSAGQYGGERHPGKFLSGREDIQGGMDIINLISQKDLIDIIIKAMGLKESSIINAVNTHHPVKKDFYTKYCIHNHLPLPHFKTEVSTNSKKITTKYKEFEISTNLIKGH